MDIVIGDPHNIPHPIKWIGNLIAFLDRKLLGNVPDQIPDPTDRNAAAEKRKGALLAATVILITALLSVISVALPYLINVKLGIIAEAVLTCYVLAATSLRRESMKVYHHLASGDIEGARKVIEREFKIDPPKVVANAIAEYRGMNDWLTHFLEDCCVTGDGLEQKSGDLYQEYRAYCLRTGEYARNNADFIAEIEKRGFMRKKKKSGMWVQGLQLKDTDFAD